jgi:hypothetical protein
MRAAPGEAHPAASLPSTVGPLCRPVAVPQQPASDLQSPGGTEGESSSSTLYSNANSRELQRVSPGLSLDADADAHTCGAGEDSSVGGSSLQQSPSVCLDTAPALRHAPAHANAAVPPRPQSSIPPCGADPREMLGGSPPPPEAFSCSSTAHVQYMLAAGVPQHPDDIPLSLHAVSTPTSMRAAPHRSPRHQLAATREPHASADVAGSPAASSAALLHSSSLVFMPPQLSPSPSIERSVALSGSPAGHGPFVWQTPHLTHTASLSSSETTAAGMAMSSATCGTCCSSGSAPEGDPAPPAPPRATTPTAAQGSLSLERLQPADWIASEYYARGGHLADSRFAAASAHPAAGRGASARTPCPATPPQPQPIAAAVAVPSRAGAASPVPVCPRSPPPALVPPVLSLSQEDSISESILHRLRLALPPADMEPVQSVDCVPPWARQFCNKPPFASRTESCTDGPTTPSSLAAYEGCASQNHGSSIAGGSPDGSFGFLGSAASISSMALESVSSPTGRRGSGGAASHALGSLHCITSRSDRSVTSVVKSSGHVGGPSRHASKRSPCQANRFAAGGMLAHGGVASAAAGGVPSGTGWPLERAARIGEEMVMKAGEHGVHGRMLDGRLSGYVEVPGGIMWVDADAPVDRPPALTVWEHSGDIAR